MARSPPGSVVPRLHCITYRVLDTTYPFDALVEDVVGCGGFAVAISSADKETKGEVGEMGMAEAEASGGGEGEVKGPGAEETVAGTEDASGILFRRLGAAGTESAEGMEGTEGTEGTGGMSAGGGGGGGSTGWRPLWPRPATHS